MAWFEKDDIEEYILEFIEYSFNKEEYYMLQGYLSTKETCDKEYREVWVQVRTYLYQKILKKNYFYGLITKILMVDGCQKVTDNYTNVVLVNTLESYYD